MKESNLWERKAKHRELRKKLALEPEREFYRADCSPAGGPPNFKGFRQPSSCCQQKPRVQSWSLWNPRPAKCSSVSRDTPLPPSTSSHGRRTRRGANANSVTRVPASGIRGGLFWVHRACSTASQCPRVSSTLRDPPVRIRVYGGVGEG